MSCQNDSGATKAVNVYRFRPSKRTVYRNVRRRPDRDLAELIEASTETDIPRHWLIIAERLARIAARESYADEHDLTAAAYLACLECRNSPEYLRGAVVDTEEWLEGFIWRAIRRAANQSRWDRGTHRRPHAIDPNVLQKTVKGRAGEADGPRIDPQRFWSDVRESLTDRQFEAIIYRHHRGMAHKEIAAKCGVGKKSVVDSLDGAERRLRYALPGYLPSRSNPDRQSGIKFCGTGKRTRDLSALMPIAMELMSGAG